MGKGCEAMKEASKDMYHWIYPESIDVPECVRKLLEGVYPGIDWDTVTFHDGTPWIFRFGNQNAITLPGTYDLHHIDIYFKSGEWKPCTCEGLAVIVHEGFHVRQYRDILDGWGLGYMRPFIIAYLSCVMSGHGSKYENDVEKPAYAQASDNNSSVFDPCCQKIRGLGKAICDCSTDPPTFDQSSLDSLISTCPNVVKTSSGISFWDTIWNNTPGREWLTSTANDWVKEGCSFRLTRGDVIHSVSDWDAYGSFGKAIARWFALCPISVLGAGILWLIAAIWSGIWFLLISILTLILAILKPVLEIILLIVDGILWVVTGIVCAAEWFWEKLTELWQWFKDTLQKICRWAVTLEKQCSEWETERTRECTEERDQGYYECSEEQDQGYSECAEKQDQGYSECCDWWPCSWACDAYVWVSNIVCVAWTWVSNIVCVAWTWISNVVCVAWTWIVSNTCKAFTWVVKKLTCW